MAMWCLTCSRYHLVLFSWGLPAVQAVSGQRIHRLLEVPKEAEAGTSSNITHTTVAPIAAPIKNSTTTNTPTTIATHTTTPIPTTTKTTTVQTTTISSATSPTTTTTTTTPTTTSTTTTPTTTSTTTTPTTTSTTTTPTTTSTTTTPTTTSTTTTPTTTSTTTTPTTTSPTTTPTTTSTTTTPTTTSTTTTPTTTSTTTTPTTTSTTTSPTTPSTTTTTTTTTTTPATTTSTTPATTPPATTTATPTTTTSLTPTTVNITTTTSPATPTTIAATSASTSTPSLPTPATTTTTTEPTTTPSTTASPTTSKTTSTATPTSTAHTSTTTASITDGTTTSRPAPPTTDSPDNTLLIVGITIPIVVLLVFGVGLFYFVKKNFLDDEIPPQRMPARQAPNRVANANRARSRFPPSSATENPVRIVEFEEHYLDMGKDSNFKFQEEYEKLELSSRIFPETGLRARRQSFTIFNRYIDILPFDESAVVLMDGLHEYINASFITGYNRAGEYIAAQGPISLQEEKSGVGRPKKTTINDFWRMIWQENARIVVMLTPLVENYRIKCAQYWPTDVSECVDYGDVSVTLKAEEDVLNGFYTARIMEVYHRKENTRRMVLQYHCEKIKDYDAPDAADLHNFITLVRTVRRDFVAQTASRGPLIVHCSAGVGRTGTFIALDSLMQHIRDHPKVDILNCVYEMRKQRCKMVQSQSQYVFIHQCLNEVIKNRVDDLDQEGKEDGLYDDVMSPNGSGNGNGSPKDIEMRQIGSSGDGQGYSNQAFETDADSPV